MRMCDDNIIRKRATHCTVTWQTDKGQSADNCSLRYSYLCTNLAGGGHFPNEPVRGFLLFTVAVGRFLARFGLSQAVRVLRGEGLPGFPHIQDIRIQFCCHCRSANGHGNKQSHRSATVINWCFLKLNMDSLLDEYLGCWIVEFLELVFRPVDSVPLFCG